MRIAGHRAATRFGRWLRSRFGTHALILGYHRIDGTQWDPFDLATSEERFAEHLESLRRLATPVSLDELVRGMQEASLPPRAVAVTFDDGYAETLYRAKPLLERFEVPATVFVASGYLGREFWWDELARLVGCARFLPDRLSLPINGETVELELGPTRSAAASDETQRHRTAVTRSLYRLLRGLSSETRGRAIAQLWEGVGGAGSGRPEHRGLEPSELQELARGEMISVGSHTVSHPGLTELPEPEVRRELADSKEKLEQLLDRPVAGFSYPNGLLTADTVTAVTACGYSYACTSRGDVARRQTSLHELPRFWPGNWEPSRFDSWLQRWLSRGGGVV